MTARSHSFTSPTKPGPASCPPRTAGDGVLMTEYLVVPECFRNAAVPDKHQWTVRVQRLDLLRDAWMVSSFCGQYVWTVYGRMERKASMSKRQLRHWCEMPLRDAHRTAQQAVAHLRVNGRTLLEADLVVVQLPSAISAGQRDSLAEAS